MGPRTSENIAGTANEIESVRTAAAATAGGTMIQIADVLGRLDKVTSAGDGKWKARCPAHQDKTPSLSVSLGDNGAAVWHCHAGCTQDAVLASLNLNGKWVGPVPPGELTAKAALKSKAAKVEVFTTKAYAIASIHRMYHGMTFTTYDYTPDFAIVRMDLGVSKTFRPVSRNGQGWMVRDPEGELPLYRVGDFNNVDVVWICEGEKCADTAICLGLPATTSSHGSKSALRTDWTPLAGKSCIILPDNDDAEQRYADDVAGVLGELGCRVKIVVLPGLPGGGDIVERVEAHDSTEDDDSCPQA